MGLFEDQQARQKRTEEFIKARDMTQGQVVEKLLKAEPELKSKGYSVNLSTYLKENKINPKEIKDTSWMRPVKQTELREKLAEREKFLAEKIFTYLPTKDKTTHPDARPYTPKIKDPIWNYIPPKTQTKQNDFLPPSATSEQILEIPQVNTGRINLDPAVSEPKTVIKEEKSNNSKYFAIGGIAIAAIVLLLILRRRK